MPKVDFDSQFKRSSFFDYPKLKLKQNEKARVTIVDKPTMEYVHTLRKVIIQNGKPLMETITYGKDGEKSKDVPATDFIGQFICLGDEEALENASVDPKNCPACAASVENSSAVQGPQRRFVVHVLKYQVKQGSFEIQKPFQAQCLAWNLSEGRFSLLVDIASEHGDLSKLDLCLGPCQNEGFQKFDIQPGGSRTLADEDNLAKAKDILQANMSQDLSPLIGRKVTADELKSQVGDVMRSYDLAFGAPAESNGGGGNNATLDFSSLIGDSEAKPEEPKPEAQAEASAEAPDLSSLASDPPSETSETSPDQPEKKTTKNDEIPDLDALLNGLK